MNDDDALPNNDDALSYARYLVETFAEFREITERACSQMTRLGMELQVAEMEAADLGEFDNRVRDWLFRND
jgi:hypothetical protein